MNEKEITEAFAKEMYKKIEKRHGRYQPFAWKDMDIKRLLMLLKQEVTELEQGLSLKDITNIRDEAVDIANYACFIYEMTKGQ